MIPTFRASGDLVLIDKLSASRLVGRRYRAGDVVIAWAPYDPERMVCKRIAAVAGDVVTIYDDDEEAQKGKNQPVNSAESEQSRSGGKLSASISAEAPSPNLDGGPQNGGATTQGASGALNNTNSPGDSNDAPIARKHGRAPLQVRVPPGHVWLVGDNAANSRDSRHYGPGENTTIIYAYSLSEHHLFSY
jgi:inner membrane protease subunit 1